MSSPLAPPHPLRIAVLTLLAIAISLLFLVLIQDFLLALIMAAVLAGLARPVYRRLHRAFGGRAGWASGATVLLTLLLIVVPTLAVLAVVVAGALQVSTDASQWVSAQAERLAALRDSIDQVPLLRQLAPYQDVILARISSLAGEGASFVAAQIAAGTVGTVQFFLLLFVMLYAMYFFLLQGGSLLSTVLAHTSLQPHESQRLIDTFQTVAQATLKGTLVVGLVQGGLAGLSFWVAGIAGAAFWAVIMALLSILPGIGTALVWIPAVAVLALQGRMTAAIGVALWCAIVVGLVDNFLRPWLVGRETRMPDLLVLLTTLGGLVLFGITGLVVGPVIGALFLAIWRIWSEAVAPGRSSSDRPAPAAAVSGMLTTDGSAGGSAPSR
jgi:predicted PurR-regulated permease PerM